MSPGGGKLSSWIVQFGHSLTDAEQARIKVQFGLALADFVPPLAYIERLVPETAARLSEDPAVRAVAPFADRLKASPAVRSSGSDNEPADIGITVTLFPDADTASVAASLAALGAKDITTFDTRRRLRALPIIRFTVSTTRLDDVAAIDGVRWIEPVAEFVDDRTGALDLQPGTAQTLAPVWDLGLHGEGQVIGLIDNGPPDISHCFFVDPDNNPPARAPQDRGAACFDHPPGDHATFVAGCAVGDDVNAPGAALTEAGRGRRSWWWGTRTTCTCSAPRAERPVPWPTSWRLPPKLARQSIPTASMPHRRGRRAPRHLRRHLRRR